MCRTPPTSSRRTGPARPPSGGVAGTRTARTTTRQHSHTAPSCRETARRAGHTGGTFRPYEVRAGYETRHVRRQKAPASRTARQTPSGGTYGSGGVRVEGRAVVLARLLGLLGHVDPATGGRRRGRVRAVHRVGDLGHLLLQVEAVTDLLEPQLVVVQLLADERLGVEVLELEVLELRAELRADVLLGALRELADLAHGPHDVLDDLRELVRTEDEHGEDNERDQLERSYVIEHLKLLAMSSVLGPRWSVRSSVVRAGSTVPAVPVRPVLSRGLGVRAGWRFSGLFALWSGLWGRACELSVDRPSACSLSILLGTVRRSEDQRDVPFPAVALQGELQAVSGTVGAGLHDEFVAGVDTAAVHLGDDIARLEPGPVA